jgi:hypothetical protein
MDCAKLDMTSVELRHSFCAEEWDFDFLTVVEGEDIQDMLRIQQRKAYLS